MEVSGLAHPNGSSERCPETHRHISRPPHLSDGLTATDLWFLSPRLLPQQQNQEPTVLLASCRCSATTNKTLIYFSHQSGRVDWQRGCDLCRLGCVLCTCILLLAAFTVEMYLLKLFSGGVFSSSQSPAGILTHYLCDQRTSLTTL